MTIRRLSSLDQFLVQFDQGIRTLFGNPQVTERKNPAHSVEESELSPAEKKFSARLMRINHAGEVAAQALYQGQALTTRNEKVKQQMKRSALEENDHLDWCHTRLRELDSHTSLINPAWYLGSLMIGAAAGATGDKWSLGFVVETEKQVQQHLQNHLEHLPKADQKSQQILQQMKADEAHHADIAHKAGGVPLPKPIKLLMKASSKVMTHTAYWL